MSVDTRKPAPRRPRAGLSGARGCIARMTAALAPSLVRRARPPEPERIWDAGARRVLEHTAGPLRIVGGPGTGKTTLLLTAVAERLAAGEDPPRTLVLVGSRRAAAGLRGRLVR